MNLKKEYRQHFVYQTGALLHLCMKLFFSKICKNTGAIFPTSQFYETFALVNECSPKQFTCVLHVDKAWKEELRDKVKNVESQTVIYKYLRIALEKTELV